MRVNNDNNNNYGNLGNNNPLPPRGRPAPQGLANAPQGQVNQAVVGGFFAQALADLNAANPQANADANFDAAWNEAIHPAQVPPAALPEDPKYPCDDCLECITTVYNAVCDGVVWLLGLVFSPFIALYHWIEKECADGADDNNNNNNVDAGGDNPRLPGIDLINNNRIPPMYQNGGAVVVGPPPMYQNRGVAVAGNEALRLMRGLDVSAERLRDRPPAMDLNTLHNLGDIEELHDVVRRLLATPFPPDENGIVPPMLSFAEQRDQLAGIDRYIAFVRDPRTNLLSQEVKNNLRLFAENITYELQKPAIPLEKKLRSIKVLSQAGEVCPAGNYAASKRELERLTDRMMTMEDKVLLLKQEFIEELVLEFVKGDVHSLNNIKQQQALSDRWGLDNDIGNLGDVLAAQDAHYLFPHQQGPVNLKDGVEPAVVITEDQVNEFLEENATPARLLEGMLTKLHVENDSNETIAEFLQSKEIDGAIQDAAVLFDGSKLNLQGMAFLLKEFDICI